MICEHRPECDGCPAFEMTFEQWRDRVTGRLQALIEPYTFAMPDLHVVPAPARERYRARACVAVRGKEFGFYRQGSRSLVPIRNCVVHSESVNRVLSDVRRFVETQSVPIDFADVRTGPHGALLTLCANELSDSDRQTIATFEWSVGDVHVNVGGKASVPLSGAQSVVSGSSVYAWRVGTRDFRASATGFVQVNPAVVDQIHRSISDHFRGVSSIADLYCGIGVHSLALADDTAKIYGFDRVESSVELARLNSKTFGRERDVWERADDTAYELRDVDIAIINPARAGISTTLTRQICTSAMPKLVYISCEPMTFFRDLERLERRFVLESVEVFEMMPRTDRMELVAVMVAKNETSSTKPDDTHVRTWVARVMGNAPNGALPKVDGRTLVAKRLRKVSDGSIVRITGSGVTAEQVCAALRRWGFPVVGDHQNGNRSVNRRYHREHFLDVPILTEVSRHPVPGFLLPFYQLPRDLLQECG